MYLEKRKIECNVSLVRSRVLSALPVRVAAPDPHTASTEHGNNSSCSLGQDLESSGVKIPKITSYIHGTSKFL